MDLKHFGSGTSPETVIIPESEAEVQVMRDAVNLAYISRRHGRKFRRIQRALDSAALFFLAEPAASMPVSGTVLLPEVSNEVRRGLSHAQEQVRLLSDPVTRNDELLLQMTRKLSLLNR